MDRSALTALYNATDGPNWTDNTNWLSDESLGDWHGVTTDGEGRVTTLDLARNNLTGTIPAELGSLSNLTELSLVYNSLTGAIPTELGNLTNLTRLYLTGNQLTGVIPTTLGSLSSLQIIALAGNQLTGSLPPELGSLSDLTTIYFGNNQLTGAIPAEVGKLHKLTQLDINTNQLAGAVPSELGNLAKLTDLHLYNNELTGALPQSFTKLILLDVFTFGDNDGLCAPTDATFQNWLQGIDNIRGHADVSPLGPNCPDLTDYDTDDDGLIEVGSLAQLDAIRYDLNGNGSSTNPTAYDAAFSNAATGMGCPSTGCTGYELTTNLDFDTNGDGRTDIAGDTYWNSGAGWQPIGPVRYPYTYFRATFEGNDNTISGLFIDRSSATSGWDGLFGIVHSAGTIRNLGLTGVDVTGTHSFGGLAGETRGVITNCYIEGTVTASGGGVGGLVGRNAGIITAGYATGAVSGGASVGGLVGENSGTTTTSYATGAVSGNGLVGWVGGLVGNNNGTITTSYATGAVSGNNGVGGLVGINGGMIATSYAMGAASGSAMIGGLVGINDGMIAASYATGAASGSSDIGGLVGSGFLGASGTATASYWDMQTSGTSTSALGEGKTTSELQSPTSATGIYGTWDDDVWDFGTVRQYPALKGLTISVAEQRQSHPALSPPGAPTMGAVTAATGMLAISWTAPSSDGGSAITAYDLRHIETSADETVDSNWTVVDDVWATGGGTLQYTLTGLTGGTQYDLQIRAVNAGGDGPWSATATGTPTTAATTTATDYDADDDGLIEVTSAAQLNAVRWDLDGDGASALANASDYAASFPNPVAGMGCPASGCTGYELDANIDLDVSPYNSGAGWEPIGSGSAPFATTLEGNGNTISGLFINRSSDWRIALFGEVSSAGAIQIVALTDVDVTGGSVVGGLVGVNGGTITASYVEGRIEGRATVGGLIGYNKGTITASYVEGQIEGGITLTGGLVGENGGTITASHAAGTVSAGSDVGGLVGWNNGGTISASYAAVTVSGSGGRVGGLVGENVATILASYAIGAVSGYDAVGGLVGRNYGKITASYATGPVSGRLRVGGLVGRNRGIAQGTTTASYWDTQTSGQSTSAGGEGKTTSELQSPTSNTGIYATWDSNVWDFGTSSQYPALKGLPISVAEQRRLGAPQSPGAPSVSATTTGAALVRLGRAIPITATFSEPVNGFTESDVTVTNSDVSNFSGSDGDSVYTFDVTPNAVGVVTVDIAAGVAQDSDSDGNVAAPQMALGLPYDDDHDGLISASEVLRAVADFFNDRLSAGHVLQIVGLFFASSN